MYLPYFLLACIGATAPTASGGLRIQVRNPSYNRQEHTIPTRFQHKTHKTKERKK
jgi:hypothetical protein